jgi:hypothetical protein
VELVSRFDLDTGETREMLILPRADRQEGPGISIVHEPGIESVSGPHAFLSW